MDSKKSGTPDPNITGCQHNVNIKNAATAATSVSATTITQHEQPAVKDDKPLDELLDFIEGNR